MEKLTITRIVGGSEFDYSKLLGNVNDIIWALADLQYRYKGKTLTLSQDQSTYEDTNFIITYEDTETDDEAMARIEAARKSEEEAEKRAVHEVKIKMLDDEIEVLIEQRNKLRNKLRNNS